MSKEKRRKGDFIERLSIILVVGAFIGGFFVMLDIKFILTINHQIIQVGGGGFSAELKGVVVQSMLITALAAVVAFWLGTTKQGQDQAQSVSKIAEASAPATAMAVAASRSDPLPPQPIVPEPIKVETVNVEANTATLTERKDP